MNQNNKTQLLHQVWDSEPGIHSKKSIQTSKPDLEKLTSTIFSPGPYYYYVIDFADRTIEHVHHSIKDIHGFDPTTVTLNDIIGAIHPDDMEYVAKAEDSLLYHFYNKLSPLDIVQYKTSYNFRMLTADGTYHLFQHNVIILSVEGTNVVSKALNIHIDINHITDQNNHKVTFAGLYGNNDFFSIAPDDSNKLQSQNITENPFTKRERQILRNLAEGKTSKEIAQQLFLSLDTVMTHRKNILAKAECKSTVNLVSKAVKEGWI